MFYLLSCSSLSIFMSFCLHVPVTVRLWWFLSSLHVISQWVVRLLWLLTILRWWLIIFWFTGYCYTWCLCGYVFGCCFVVQYLDSFLVLQSYPWGRERWMFYFISLNCCEAISVMCLFHAGLWLWNIVIIFTRFCIRYYFVVRLSAYNLSSIFIDPLLLFSYSGYVGKAYVDQPLPLHTQSDQIW